MACTNSFTATPAYFGAPSDCLLVRSQLFSQRLTGIGLSKSTQAPSGYADWLAELKTRIHTAQQRAALAVNRELVLLYWQIGRDILERQAQLGWERR